MSDPLVVAAGFLGAHIEWMRHRPEVAEFADVIDRAARIVEGIVDKPGDRRWLGQCGADLDGDERCEGDVYARVGAVWARCRACGASYATDERRAWLDGLTREHPYTARDIEEAHGIRRGTIRVWVHRGLLQPALVQLHEGVHGPQELDLDPNGEIRYPLDAVLDLAASEAVRRAQSGGRRRAPIVTRGLNAADIPTNQKERSA